MKETCDPQGKGKLEWVCFKNAFVARWHEIIQRINANHLKLDPPDHYKKHLHL